jgi:hypothetical protein
MRLLFIVLTQIVSCCDSGIDRNETFSVTQYGIQVFSDGAKFSTNEIEFAIEVVGKLFQWLDYPVDDVSIYVSNHKYNCYERVSCVGMTRLCLNHHDDPLCRDNEIYITYKSTDCIADVLPHELIHFLSYLENGTIDPQHEIAGLWELIDWEDSIEYMAKEELWDENCC